jgi:hypothetical protein
VISQSHFTVSFPLTSPTDGKVEAEQLPSLMPRLFRAADAIGTIHYSRFTVLSEKTLLFLGDFGGEIDQLMSELATRAGSVFDFIFQHVDNSPSIPVDAHADAFAEWMVNHLLTPVNLYTAETYIADYTKNIGEVFDLIFNFCINPPPSPCRKHLQEFIDFAAGANRTPIGFCQGYPGLGVRDIHALIADSRTQAAAN